MNFHKLLFLLTIAIGCYSCQTQPNQKTDASKNQQEQNIKLVQQFFEHFNHHDWPKMASMYTDPADFKDPSLGLGIVKQTHEETIKKYAELNKVFPDLHDEVIEVYPSGENHITVEFISSGTASDGSTFKLPICTIFTIEDGKISKDYTYFDN